MGGLSEQRRTLDRREFLKFTLVAAAGVASACVPPLPGETPPISPVPLSPEAVWNGLSPLDRISRLESGEKGEFTGNLEAEPEKELVKAVAEFYCSRVNCLTSPEALAAKVEILTPDQLVNRVNDMKIQDLQESLTPNENRLLREQVIERTLNTGEVLINSALYQKTVQLRQENPDFANRYRGKDMGGIVLKNILLHAFSHANQTNQPINFNPPLKINFLNNIFTVTGTEGFQLTGTWQEGKQVFIESGEAATEFVAEELGKKTDTYFSLVDEYTNSAKLLRSINGRAGISPQDFLKYASGEFFVIDFLKKWGALKNPQEPDLEAAVTALVLIGLVARGVLTYAKAQENINQIFQSNNSSLYSGDGFQLVVDYPLILSFPIYSGYSSKPNSAPVPILDLRQRRLLIGSV